MVRVKICGITNVEDAQAAIEAGANALGFVFAESPRKINVQETLSVLETVPPFIATVGVFANQSSKEVLDIWERTGLHFAQIHDAWELDDASSEYEHHWSKVIRALRIESAEDIRKASGNEAITRCAALLLDTHVEGLMGGTGQTFDWDLAVQAQSLGRPIILAGGLTPGNVGEAIRQVSPYAVDVSTGVEACPGKKDHAKIKEFIDNVHRQI